MSSQQPIPTADRISALPDSLICHILSFLPTKLAVATSVLSKSWTPLWRSVLTLDFEVDRFADFSIFHHFVCSVINSREVALPLRSFRIKCGVSINFNPFHVNQFVDAAVQRQIENFDLDLFGVALGDMEKLTPSVFSVLSCRTLVVLKLKNLMLSDAPQLVDLPLLKTLNLDSVIFDGSSAHFNILVHGCPILEDFHTHEVGVVQYDENDEFNGFPCLLRAHLYVNQQNLPLLWFHNAKFLHAELWNTYEYGVPTFPNLTHMELVFHSRDYNSKWGWVIEVLQNCPKLQNLTIDQAGEFRDKFENKDSEDLETVPECLSSRLRTCSLGGFSGHRRELQFAKYIMMNSKLLSTMTIKSSCLVDGNKKHQLLVKLSSYQWGSPTCKLLFD